MLVLARSWWRRYRVYELDATGHGQMWLATFRFRRHAQDFIRAIQFSAMSDDPINEIKPEGFDK